MKITVLGATGGTGLQVVEQALARGFEVAACVRDASRLPKPWADHPNFRVMEGELADTPKLAALLEGSDAVLCCLGTKELKNVFFMQKHLPDIMRAMEQGSCRRLILLSAYGVGKSFDSAGFVAKLAYRTMVKSVYADKALSEQALMAGDLDWTLVLPVILNDGALADDVAAVPLERIRKVRGLPKVSRANVAKAMLDCAVQRSTVHRHIVVAPEKSLRLKGA